MKPLDMLIAMAVPIAWGMGLVVAKPVVDGFPPLLLMALRFATAALVLAWFVPIPRAHLKGLFWAALVGLAFQYGFTFYGLRYLDAGTTALLVQVEVVFLVLIAAALLREPISLRQGIGMAIAFAGIVLITGEPRLDGQELGISFVMIGAAAWAMGQIMIRRLGQMPGPLPGRMPGLTTIAWVALFAAPQLLVISLVVEGDPRPALASADWQVWSAVLYLGLVMTAIGYGCWYHVLGRYRAGQAGPFLLLTPVASVLGGWLFLGEPLTWQILVGGAVVLAGVALLVLEWPNPKRQRV
ncbi:MAG: EamA family transporter [Pseudomonadota bacterium]